MSVDWKGEGVQKPLKQNLISLLFTISIFLYRFSSITTITFVARQARCFPMHVRAPKLNPPKAYGSTSSWSSQRWGSNLRGCLKYFSLQWLGRSSILRPTPLRTGMLSMVVSLTASRRKMLVAGPYMRVVSSCTHSRYFTSRTFEKESYCSEGTRLSTSRRSRASTSGCSHKQQKTMFVKRLVESLPAAMKAMNYSTISFSSRGDSCFCPLLRRIEIASQMSVYFSRLGLSEASRALLLSIMAFTSAFILLSFEVNSLYFLLIPHLQAFSPNSKTKRSVDCALASLRMMPRYLLMDMPSMVEVVPSAPKKQRMMILEMISPKTFLSSVWQCSSPSVCLTRLPSSILSSISLQISFIFGTLRLMKSKLKTSDSTLRLLFQASPSFMIIELPRAILKPYLLRCDFWKRQFFSGAKRCLMSLGLTRMSVTIWEVLLTTTSTFFQACFSSWKASPYSFSLKRWFSSSMILCASQGKAITLYPIASSVSRYHAISRFGRRWYLQQQRANRRSAEATAATISIAIIMFVKAW